MSSKYKLPIGLIEKAMRIDKLLWFLRLSRSRAFAKKMTEKGHVRLNGRRVDRGHLLVRPNDILTIPIGKDVRIVRVIELPKRRNGAVDAQSCYEILEPG